VVWLIRIRLGRCEFDRRYGGVGVVLVGDLVVWTGVVWGPFWGVVMGVLGDCDLECSCFRGLWVLGVSEFVVGDGGFEGSVP